MAISMDCLGTPEYMYYCKYTCIIPGLVYHGFILELLIIAPHQPPPPPPRGDIPAKSMLTSGSA